MATLTVRNLDEALKTRLRLQAASHGCSMEQEVRDILRRAVQRTSLGADFAERIHRRFVGLDAEMLPIPERRPARLPVTP